MTLTPLLKELKEKAERDIIVYTKSDLESLFKPTIFTKSFDLFIDNFLKKQVVMNNGCIEYTGHITKLGYGAVTMPINKKENRSEKIISSHRLMFIIKKGLIKKGMFLDHICKNRKCFNIEHLREVTPTQNTLENSDGICAKNKFKTHCKRGHEFNSENTYKHKKGRTCNLCNDRCRRVRILERNHNCKMSKEDKEFFIKNSLSSLDK